MGDTTRHDSGIWIEGSLNAALPVDAMVRNIADGELYVSTNALVPVYTQLTNVAGGSGLGVSITRISAGTATQYGTIALALGACVAGDVVVLGAGAYAEDSLVIPDDVSLVGFPLAVDVRIVGGDTTSTRVSLGHQSVLAEITVEAPSVGANPGIDCTGLGLNELCAVRNTICVGAGGSGALLLGAGLGTLTLARVVHSGGVTTGAFVHISGGYCLFESITARMGTSAVVAQVDGSGLLQGADLAINVNYNAVDGLQIGGTADVHIVGMIAAHVGASLTNAVHFVSDGGHLHGNAMQIKGSAWDILVDPALTGVGSLLIFEGTLSLERFSAPAVWTGNASVLVTAQDQGVLNDMATRFGGEIAVGTPFFPSESAFGEGDSTVTGMHVLSDDGTGTAFVDNTAAASSPTGSTFALWQALTAGHVAYFGSETFENTGLKIDGGGTAIDLAGGSLIWEFWNGATWQTFNVMASDADAPYSQKAQAVFGITSTNDQIRFDKTTINGSWATTAVNGVTAYWVRCRIAVGINAIPVLERVKLGTNRTELNKDGKLEFFGDAEVILTFWEGTGADLSPAAGGANAPTDLDVTVSANVSYRQQYSTYAAGSDLRRAGTFVSMPDGIDTSRPITMHVYWMTDGVSALGVQFDIYLTPIDGDAVLGALAEQLDSQTIAAAGVIDDPQIAEFQFDVSSLVPGEAFAFTIWPKRGTDTNPDDLGVLSFHFDGHFWAV